RIRSVSNAPVLFLTAKSAESSLLNAFQSGGDDFLTKPFSNDELLVKIGSLLRRYTQYKGKPQEAIVIDQLEVDLTARMVTMAGEPVSLTDTEYSILEYMLQHRGETLTAEDIYTGVWKEKYLSTASNTIMVHILNLRKKLESKSSSTKIIKTVWGKGYRID
ncbi:MAG: response regulator transcription factor, partial [Oscillospiraceae bacterium]|nr:response regulator transcription factor [Oscillospiraceae bacterium]